MWAALRECHLKAEPANQGPALWGLWLSAVFWLLVWNVTGAGGGMESEASRDDAWL